MSSSDSDVPARVSRAEAEVDSDVQDAVWEPEDGSELDRMSNDGDEQVERNLTAVTYEGYIDAIEAGRVYGWALDPLDKSKRITVSLFHGRDKLADLVADRFREDLVGYGDGSGKHAFVYNIDRDLRNRPASEFHAYFAGTDIPLLRGAAASDIQPDDVKEATDAGPAKSVEAVDVDKLAGRIEALERSMVAMLRVIQPHTHRVEEFHRASAEMDRKYNQVVDDMQGLEAFVIRVEKTLSDLVDTADTPRLSESRRTGRWSYWAVTGVLTVGSAALIVWLLHALGWL